MKSKWFELKNKAISLRKKGKSIRDIEKDLGIPKSTLSGWLKNIKLTSRQRNKLLNDWKRGLINARKKASLWHFGQRDDRRKKIRQEVENFASGIKIDKEIGELILATLYLGEGGKKESNFVIANSNSELLKGVINLLRYLYKLDESKFRCCLHLRKDQNEKILIKFWSKVLGIAKEKFLKTQFDKRTVKKTYSHYKGVCVINYYDIELQRRVLYIGDKIIKMVNNLRD